MNKEFHREITDTWVPKGPWLHKEKRELKDNLASSISTFDSSTSSAKIEQKGSYGKLIYQEAYEFSNSR